MTINIIVNIVSGQYLKLQESFQIDNWKKYDFVLVLSEDPAALCLDRSPGAYYISKKGHP